MGKCVFEEEPEAKLEVTLLCVLILFPPDQFSSKKSDTIEDNSCPVREEALKFKNSSVYNVFQVATASFKFKSIQNWLT